MFPNEWQGLKPRISRINTNPNFDYFDFVPRTLPFDMPSRIPSLRLAEGER
jgi:hypothetical protein